MRVTLDGLPFRALYTERVGKKGMTAPNDTLLLMYASHDGRQQLVGIAGSARYVDREDDAKLIRTIKKQVRTAELWSEAWKEPLVQKCFGTQKALRDHWETIGELNPNWVCPEESFFWLEEPLDLDPAKITGKSKLLTMFSSFTDIPAERAAYLLDSIPAELRNSAWRTIRESLDVAAVAEDVKNVARDKRLDETTQKALIDARRGQGHFRDELLRLYGRRCALTGCGIEEVLRASHIRPGTARTTRSDSTRTTVCSLPPTPTHCSIAISSVSTTRGDCCCLTGWTKRGWGCWVFQARCVSLCVRRNARIWRITARSLKSATAFVL
jgi:hypothetical protein